MGMLSGLSGILFASCLQSATPTAGTLFKLDPITVVYICGMQDGGGIGKVTGSLIGALVYISPMNAMNLMGTDISLQYVIRGAVLAATAIFVVETGKSTR